VLSGGFSGQLLISGSEVRVLHGLSGTVRGGGAPRGSGCRWWKPVPVL